MADILTIRETVQRAKNEGIPLSDYTLRMWIRGGRIPVRLIGRKALIYYPNLIKFLQCETTQAAPVAEHTGVRSPVLMEVR